MSSTIDRRGFLGLAPAAVALGLVPAWAVAESTPSAARKPAKLHPEFPTHDPQVVRDVVAAAHTDVDRVRQLVSASPALAKASWDWGFGDWESALGAASHMGRRDIAELLIGHGARPNLFTHVMLGDLAVVKAAVAAQPGIQRIPGPHGITLLQHARIGKQDEVAAYLTELGDADIRATSLETSDEQKQRYLGRYVFGDGSDDAFDVITNSRGSLAIRRGQRFGRALNRVEDHGFAPGGAPDVRVRFRVAEGKVVSLTIHDPHPLVTATRVD